MSYFSPKVNLWQRMLRWVGLSPGPSDDFWYTAAAGQQTAAGIRVDEQVAMTYSGCWAATMLLATCGAMVPLKLFRKLGGGGSEPADDLRLYWMAHDQFNRDMTNFMFRSSRFCQQINWGNTFGEIEYNGADQIHAVHPIHPSRIPAENVKRDESGVYYLVNNDDGTKTPIDARDMLHIPSPISDDGIWGRGVVTQARLSIGFGIATETQGAAYMANSARPTVVLSQEKTAAFKDTKDREEFRRMWMEQHGGPANSGKPAIMPPGMTATAWTWNAQDSQFLETRQHNIEEIARWYGVPPHLIGHLLRSTYNNIEHQSLEFVKYSLMRWLVPWEQELNRKLLSVEERKTLYFRHVVEGLERGDLMTRTQALKEKFFNGEITLNEWRGLDDLPPIEGEAGNTHFLQQAMVPLEIAAKGPQQPEPEEEPAEEPTELEEPKDEGMAARLEAITERLAAIESAKAEGLAAAVLEIIEATVAGMLEREAKHAREAAQKPSQFLAWLDTFYDDHAQRMERALAKPVKACLLASGRSDGIDDVLKGAVGRHVAAGREALLAAASGPPDKFASAVESCVSTWQRGDVLAYLGACNGKH